MRVAVQIVIVLVLLGGSAGLAQWMIANRPRVEAAPVEPVLPAVATLTVEPAPFQLQVQGRGEVGPREETRLVSEVEGRVTYLSPDLVSGGSFTAGEVLVRLDTADLEALGARAASSLEQARGLLMREQAEATVAARQYDELGDGQASELALHKPQLVEAQARVTAAEAELAQAQRNLERAELRAPFDGRVRSEDVGAGQLVSRGQVLAELFATDRAEVRVPIHDRDLAYLELETVGVLAQGPEVWLEAEFAGALRRWRGRVLRVEGEIDRTSRMVTLVVGVEDPYGAAAEQAGAPLMPGLFVGVTFAGRSVPAAILLPRTALRGDGRVFLVDGEQRLRFRPVQVGWRDGTRVLVTSGLEPGDRVCVSPMAAPVDGMGVRLLDPAPGADE